MMLSEIERASEAQSSVRGVGVFRAAGTLWLIMAALLSLKAGAQEKLPPGGLSLVKVLIETSPTNLLVNGSSRIHVSGVFSDGTTNDITRGANGTTYLSLAPTVVSVDSNGVATGLAAGQASIFIETARGHKSGLSRLITLFVGGNGDTDGDGLPDVFEVANGLNPNDPTDGELDPDRDRLSNLEEFLLGTDPGKEDTDGDGFADGEELQRGSNPTHADFERCTASILNRTGPFDSSGSFLIPNVPVEPGFFRVRVVCEGNGRTVVGQSSFFSLVPAGVPADLIEIHFGVQDAIPVSLRIDSSKTTFVAKGETARCVAIAVLPDRSSKDRTLGTQGTLWSSSNPEIADVSPDGVVTAKARGQAIIQARNEGVLASLTITSLIPNDADSDGMTDEYERANALNPNDASDAAQDSDNDGLTNFQEFQRGTNPRNADTDGDGLTDASEIVRGTDPLRADSDGDGLADGEEVGLGSNPTSKDTDTDGIPDALELRLHLNPVLANPTTTVRGRVSLANGAPVAGATALLFDFLTATTDSNGLFTLAGVPTNLGPVSIVARLIQGNQVFDGFSASTTPVVGGVTDVGAIQLQLNAGTVAGLVIDPAGRPVTGVQITVSSGPDTRTTLTDVLGRYQVGNITAGNIDVTARDYRTGLRARGSGTLPLNASTSMNLQLTAVATITGTVFLQDGTNSAGAGVTVTLLGQGSRNTTTDELGRYTFDFVPLGPFSVEASDPAGSRGRNAGNLSTTGRTVLTDLTFLGRGNATGLVFNGAGSLATNAVVQLRSRSVFGGSATITTGSSNRFAFSNVFVGDFDVTAFVAATRLAGYASGRIDREGQSVALNITVAEAGSFTGTVFRADGSTPVAGAQIILSPTRLSATTDAEGRFRFDFLPLGGYDFDVTDPATGDRGRASGSLVQQDQVQGVDIRLLGFGSILVTVLDGGGKVSPGARVSLSSSSGFDFTRTLTTEANGVARFDDFLSGSFTVAAFDPSTQLSGSTSGTLVAGGTANTIVNLQQAGSISGAIFAADGSNVVANIRLSLGGPVGRQAQSGVDGRFTFNNLPLGTYSIDAHDGADNLRARATGFSVASQGQQLVRNLVLSGVGTVNGTVVLATGPPVPNIPLTLRSDAPGSRGSFNSRTDVNGRYAIDLVPVGTFTVNVSTRSGNELFLGSTNGALTKNSETVNANVVVSTLFDPQPTVRYDANNMTYDVAGNGAIEGGTRSIFQGNGGAARGSGVLDIIVNGSTNRFSGDQFGTFEEAGKEIVVVQNGLAGLNVTRKVYVPRDGYFARCLDLINNPSSAAITFNVRVTSFYSFIAKNQGGFRYQREPRILSTSSGDATFATLPTTDQWLIIDDDDDGDPFLITTLPATADVFDGPGATLAAGALDYSIDFDALFGRSSQEWEALTLQPGETLALMRFVTEQTSRAAARASAERLVQLPPEALTGLSPIEVTQIRNFKLPPNGVSPLSALSPLVGTVRGMALAADGVMAVPNANLRFRSSSPFFGRTHSRTTDGDGRFSFAGGLNDSGSSTAIPVADFTLLATDGLTGQVSPEASGSFGDGLLVVDQNVIFSNSGILFGTVSRAGGEVVTVGNVTLSGGALLNVISSGLSGDGTYLFRVVPPGTYTATATLPIPDGTDLSAAVSTSLTAGGTTRTDIVLPQTGGVVGTLFTGAGDAGVNQPIYLQGNQFQRQVQTGTGGQFSFLDVPIGSFTVSAYEPHTGVISVSNAVVLADSILTQNLRFIGLGIVHLKATLAGGAAAIRAPVQISEFARGGSFRSVGNTDLNGELLLSDVPQGLFTLRVLNPGNTALFSQINGSIVSDAQIVEAVAVVPMDAPPIVTLLAPLAGTNVIEGARISLSASASDDIGIRYVEFIVDGQSMASDFSAPFSAIVTLPLVSVDRDLIITALAVDTGTNRSQSSVTIRVLDDTQPPTVTLVEPANNATVKEGTAITLRATANDNVALSRVEFSAEGVPFGNDPTSPYTWVYTIPSDYARLGPKKLLLAATAYDVSSLNRTSIVTLNVISDDPPRVTVTVPGNGTRIVEGSTFTVAATAADDVGVALVEFFVDGALVGADVSSPYTNRFQITSGIGDSTVLVEAVATDTLGQRATNAVRVVRLNDTNAPRVTIAAPADGSIVTVGDSDIAIIVDNSGSTSSSSGADVDGDGRTDSILKAEVFSGLQLLNFLNPTNTRVSIVVFNTSATLRQSLTNNFTVARQVLTNVLIAGPTGLTDFNNAMRVATDELAGLRARRSATAVQLFLSDGTASYPATEVTRASLGGICVNTFAVGSGANPTILRQIATNTSCVFTPVVNPSELVRILPRIILFGINQLAVVADAVDDVALRSVDFSVASSVGTFSSADTLEPFQILFGLPVLTNSLSLTLLATATDFGDNRVVSSPVRVTLLPAENGPQVNRLTPSSGRAGTNVTILGKFFHPIPTNNVVTFNGLRAKVVSGNKISLMVQVPAGATTGPVIVESEGLQSSGIAFTLLQPGAVAVAEMDAESLDEGPVASNLDEAELVPIELLDISLKNGIFRCSISTVVGKLCIVESTDSLIHPMWQVVTQINGDGLTHAVADRHDEGSKQRFYRIRIE